MRGLCVPELCTPRGGAFVCFVLKVTSPQNNAWYTVNTLKYLSLNKCARPSSFLHLFLLT